MLRANRSQRSVAIAGITLPGMPLGSTGMGGAKQEPFEIYEISNAEPKLFMTE